MPVLERKRFDLTADKRSLMEAMLRRRGIQAKGQTIPRRPEGGAAPLSFAQQRLWFLEQLEGPSALYNIPAAFRIRGPLDLKTLEAALTQVASRHETLRARFQTVDGEAVQAFADGLPMALDVVDFSAEPIADRESMAREAARVFAQEPFDLATGPLARARVMRLDAEDHVVVVSLHHIAADGWSMKVLARELGALTTGQPLPELPVRYSDFAAWQRERLPGQELASQLEYWRCEMKNAPAALELPTDLPRPQRLSHCGNRYGFRVPAATLDRLEALATAENATLFMVLMASWQALLFRYTGQADVVVGSPVANRTRPEVEGLIGFFVNMLPIRATVSPEESFRDLLRHVREKTVKAYENQDLPFEKLVDELQLPRDLNRTPLFQTVLVLQNASEGLSAEAGREVEVFHVDTGMAKFDLTLDISKDSDGAAAFLEHRTDLFTEAAIDRMARHWLTMLDAIVQNPDQAVCRLRVLLEDELRFLRQPRTAAAVTPPAASSIQRQFQAQVRRTPDRPALTFEGWSLTYAELDRRSNAVAARLQQMGAGPEVRVAMCMERSAEMVVAILGILKSGAAYVPIDPSCPRDRIAYIVGDAHAPILLTTKDRPEASAEGVWQTLFLEDVPGEGDEEICVDVPPAASAYVIYTSGSTGKPKGVVVDHGNVLRLLTATEPWFHFDENDVWTLFHSYAFDFSVWELWGALLYGGRLLVVPYWVSRSPESFYQLLCDEGVTVLNQTPSAFRQLMQVDEQAGGASAKLKLRYVVFGGEALELQSLRGWYERHPDSPTLVNMYGITETTVHVTYRALAPSDLARGASSVIGVPIPDLEVYLLDPWMQPVPVGVAGEIYVGGAGVARGYHERPELTATRFVPDPFSERPGARLYRSGDLARMLPDGDLDYLGRIDHQVKIRGFRIETGEIEAVLNQHPAICESAVMVRTDQPGDPRLTAYFVSRTSPAPSQAELREHLKRQLPDYMVPASIVMLDSMPLTVNGKVDRRALPAPETVAPSRSGEFVEPRSETERKLAEIWAQVLRVPQVGLDDNFFELGGDSILSIQAVARANQAGIRITPKQLFQAQTVKGLAELADARQDAVQQATQLTPGPAPLTPIQSWFFEQNLPNPKHWNQAVLLELRQPVAATVLERAFRAVVERHAAFRLRFQQQDGTWTQTYNDAVENLAAFERHDLSALPAGEQAVAFDAAVAAAHRAIDIAVGPLVRAAYFELSDGARLLIVAHHLVVDGISWRVLVEELEIACSQVAAGQPVALPDPTAPFAAWGRQLTQYADSDAIRQEDAYWSRVANGMPQPPFSICRDANREESARSIYTELDQELTQGLLQRVPQVYRTRINDSLLASLGLAFQRVMGLSRVAIDLEGHGRESLFEDFDLSRTVGWFTSIYPVALEIPSGEDAGAALKAVKETLRAVPNNGIGYGIARYLGRRLPDAPDPAISFNYLGQFDRAAEGASLFRLLPGEWGPAHDPAASRRHALDITAYVSEDRLRVAWTFAPGMEAQVEALAAAYLQALRDIVAHCGSAEAGGFTPSDFPQAKVNQKDLDKLMGKLKRRPAR